MTEAALKRDAARRKEDGSGLSPLKQRPINLTVKEGIGR